MTRTFADMITYDKLSLGNIKEVSPVMKAAFDDDALRFQKKESGGPPGYDDGRFLEKWGLESDSHSYVVRHDEIAIGAFIVFWNPGEESILGNIFIDPKQQNRGIGTAVWEFIRRKFPSRDWKLETVSWATRNHHFYEKLGFKKIGVENEFVYYTLKCEPGS